MKRIITLLIAILLCLSLAGCGGKGDTSLVRLDQGASETLAREDVRGAMDAAMAHFRRHCSGMTLLRLRYDEAYSTAWITARDQEPDGGTIVLLATYRDGDGKEHTGVPWALTRSGDGTWKADDLK